MHPFAYPAQRGCALRVGERYAARFHRSLRKIRPAGSKENSRQGGDENSAGQ